MQKHILKWQVPIDDQPHDIGRGRIVHVDWQGSRHTGGVVVWTEEIVGDVRQDRWVQVVGTGHQYASYGVAVGTCLMPDTGLVWHVIEFKYHKWKPAK